jgi:hypothetical protein
MFGKCDFGYNFNVSLRTMIFLTWLFRLLTAVMTAHLHTHFGSTSS